MEQKTLDYIKKVKHAFGGAVHISVEPLFNVSQFKVFQHFKIQFQQSHVNIPILGFLQFSVQNHCSLE
jgi:hypothetical protein